MALTQTEMQTMLEQQQQVIQQLQATLGIRSANDTDTNVIDINNHVVKVPYKAFPKVIYRPGGSPKQVDHPGLEAMTVQDAAQEQAAVEEGWFATIQEALEALAESRQTEPASAEWSAPKKRGK